MKYLSFLLLLPLVYLAGCVDADKAAEIAGETANTRGVANTIPPSQPALIITPSTYSFGTKSLSTSTTQTFTVYNQANVTTAVNSVSLTGNMYSISTDTCTGVVLAGGASCTVSVTFTPTMPSNFVSFVTIDFSSSYSNIASATFNMSGAGAGAEPTLTISPSTYAFGNIATNATSAGVFTVSNPSSVTAYAVTPSVSGADFSILSETCGGNNLSSGASCSVTVSFAPSSVTSRAGNLRLDFSSLSGSPWSNSVPLTGTGVAPTVAFAFSGFNSPGTNVSTVTPTGAQLNWTAQVAATRYRITRILPAPVTIVATIDNTATSNYILTGLTPGETYQFRINAYDALEVSDGNSNIASFTTPVGTSATFNGWSDVIATGSVYSDIGAVDVAWGNIPTGIAPSPPTWPTSITDSLHIVSTSATKQNAVVKLAWDAFTFSGGGVATSHKVYRATVSGGPYTDVTSLGSNVLASNTFIDNSVSNETTYYYKIHPEQGGEIIPAAAPDTEIKVYVPPQNMALVHRWIANRETCVNLLGKSFPADFDRANNYRCNYVWGRSSSVHGCSGAGPAGVDPTCNHAFAPNIPWNDKAYWDIGVTLIADRYETGCKISPKVGSSANTLPGAGFVDGDVFYASSTTAEDGGTLTFAGRCYLRDAGTWKSYVAGTASVGQHASITTNQPGYPPTNVSQAQAFNTCQQRTVAGIGPLRLWRRHEMIAAKAWSGVHNPKSFIQSTVYTSGSDLATNGGCNTSYGNGVVVTSPIISTAKYNMMAVSGSWATRNCNSRYEIQDLIGNIMEWTSDQMYSCNINDSCTFGVSTLDSGNIHLDGFVYNNSMGRAWFATWEPGYHHTPYYHTVVTNLMLPMFGVSSPSVDADLGSRTMPAGYITEELGNLPSRLQAMLVLVDGMNLYPGRFSLAPVIDAPNAYFIDGPNGGAYMPFGHRCVGEVP